MHLNSELKTRGEPRAKTPTTPTHMGCINPKSPSCVGTTVENLPCLPALDHNLEGVAGPLPMFLSQIASMGSPSRGVSRPILPKIVGGVSLANLSVLLSDTVRLFRIHSQYGETEVKNTGYLLSKSGTVPVPLPLVDCLRVAYDPLVEILSSPYVLSPQHWVVKEINHEPRGKLAEMSNKAIFATSYAKRPHNTPPNLRIATIARNRDQVGDC